MKKQLFKILIAMAMVLLLFSLYGCNSYTSKYKAVAIVRTNTSKSASMSFYSLEGTMVFKLKCENEDEKINYSAKLEEGSAKVFYDCDGTKTELFSVSSGDDISDVGGTLKKGTVYIIVEMSESGKNGQFIFDIKQ